MAYSTFPSDSNAISQPDDTTIKPTKRRSSGGSALTTIHSSNLGPYDIVCGRCVNAYNNIGNRRFRVTIRLNLAKYQTLRSRHVRSLMFVSLVRFLKSEVGVRFFKPIRDKQLNKDGQWYIEMTEKEARDKVGHAFRDLARTAKTQKQSTAEAEKRMDATLSQMINQHHLPVISSPTSFSNSDALGSIRNECPPPSATPTTTVWGRNVMTCDNIF